MPVYRHNGDVYDIPQDKAREFESQFPDATVEVYSGNDVYDIPVGVQDEFFSRYSDASYSAPSAPSAEEVAEDMQPQGVISPQATPDEIAQIENFNNANIFPQMKDTNLPFRTIEEKKESARIEEQIAAEEAALAAHREAERKRLHEDGTIQRMENAKEEARKNKSKAFGEALAYTPQVSSFGVASNIYDSTEEQLADAQRAMEASAEHRQNKLLHQRLYETLDMVRQGDINVEGSLGIGDATRGAWDSATRLSTWDVGISETLNALTYYDLVKKWEENPESLTATENALLDAIAETEYVNSLYSDQTGFWYGVGQSLPQSAAFMGETMLNPANALGQTAMKKVVRELGKRGVSAAARRGAGITTRVVGDIAEAAISTATTRAGHVIGGAIDRNLGSMDFSVDNNGYVHYEGQEDDGVGGWEAMSKEFGAQFLGGYSEKIGATLIDPALDVLRGVTKGAVTFERLDKFVDALNNTKASKLMNGISNLRKKAHLDSTLAEILEEEFDMLMNARFIGDNNFGDPSDPNSVFNLRNQLTTIASTALTMFGINAVEFAGNYANKRTWEKQVDEFDKAAGKLYGDGWESLRESIDMKSPQEVVDELTGIFMNQDVTLEQKRAIMNYAMGRIGLQSYNVMDKKVRDELYFEKRNALDAYEAGRHAQLPQYYNINQEYRGAEAAINERENAEEIWDAIRLMNNMDENERQNIMRDFSEEDQELIRNWRYNAYRWQGAINHRAEQVEDLVDEYAGQVNPYTRPDGTLTTAILGDNVVYVMSEAENGDAVVYTNDGRKIFCKMRDLEHVQQHNAEELIERFRQQTTEVVNQETEKNLNYPSEVFEPAVNVEVQTADGKTWLVTAVNGDDVQVSEMVLDRKSNTWNPNGAPKNMTRTEFMDWQKAELDRKKANTYEQGDELTFYVNGEPIDAEITGIDPEGNYYVHVSNLVDGLDKSVSDVYTAEELRKLTTPSSKVSEKTTENESTPTEEIKQSVSEEVTNSQIEDNVTEPTAEVVNTALSRVPKDAKGNPLYEQTDADTAWDAIMEQTEGDADMAQRIAEEMVADKKAALDKMQKGKPKKGATVAEKIANEKAHIAAIAQAEQEVAAWEKIAQTEARRREAAMSEADRYAAEMEQKNISEGLSALGEPQSLQEYVLAQLAGGAYKLCWNDKENGTKGFGSHTGLSTEEMKARLSMIDNKNGLTPEEIAHSIVENMDASFGEVDVMDVTDMVIDAVSTYASRRAMLNGMVEARAELIRQQEVAEQEAKDAWYMEQYHATEEELAAYNEYLAEFAKEIYGEDVDYEQRIATFAEIQLENDNQGTDAGLRSSADTREGLTSDREGGRSVGETEQLNQREVLGDAAGVAASEDQGIGSSVSAQSDVENKPTANVFEMAEEAQKKRKSKKKKDDTARRSIQESSTEADRVSGEIFGGESLGEGESVSSRGDGGILEEGAGKKKRTAKARRQSDNRQEARDGKAERLSRGISPVQQQAIDEYTRTNPWDANFADDERGVLNMYRMATINELDELAHKLADKINSGKATPRDRMRYDVLAAYAKSGELKAVADAMGVEYDSPVSLDTIKDLFEKFNSDPELTVLFNRVFPLVKEINPTIVYRRFTKKDLDEGEDVSPDDILGQYSLQDNLIEYNRNQIDSNHCTEQEKASTIVHEMIHAVARYAIRVQEAHNNGVELDIQLPKRLLDAAQSLIEVYDTIKDNEIFNDDRYESGKMYGVSSVHEMLSELADPEFREKLKQVSIENLPSDKRGLVRDALRAIKDFIHRMFGWDSSSAYARTKRALDKLIDNYDSAGYNKARELTDDDFAQQIRPSSEENLRFRDKEEQKELIAVHNISEDNLKKVLEAGSLIMPSIAITKADMGHDSFGEISLLFDKSTINPSDRRNKVYGGDAWTPRFPEVRVKVDSDVVKRVRETIYDAIKDERLRSAYSISAELHPSNVEDAISKYGIDSYYRQEWMKLAYLLANGKRVKIPMKKKSYGYGTEKIYELIKERGLSVRDIYNDSESFYGSNPDFVAEVKEIVNEAKLANVPAEQRDELRATLESKPFRFMLFDLYIGQALQMEDDIKSGAPKESLDKQALRDLVEKKVKTDNADYNKWVDNLFEGIVEKRGIRNDRDLYTPSGNHRSWEQLYDPATPANILKHMLAVNEQGGSGGLFDSNIMGASAETYESIEEIRKKGKQRLKKLPYEEYDEWSESVGDRMSDIVDDFLTERDKVKFGSSIDAKIEITKAVAKDKTAKGIYKHMHREYPNFTMEHAKQVEEIVKEIQEFATGYFEAKPQRLVSVNEVMAAIVPSNASKEIVDALKNNGIEVITYKKGDEEARKRVVKRVSSSMNIRFRDGAPFFSNAERAVENIKQNKATPEQWLAMIKKDGGLKAGEDKWMGLSDWLNEQKENGVKSMTKDEVLAFIRENQIEIEEVEYSGVGYDEWSDGNIRNVVREALGNAFGKEFAQDALSAFVFDYDDNMGVFVDYIRDDELAVEMYNAENSPRIEYNSIGWLSFDESGTILSWMGGKLAQLEKIETSKDKPINSTRLNYTTEGLDNKREIALVVPTIEPWNQSDTIHFGDAGEGRAVAWVRFGETTDEDGNRVLVIDEVQSKRHDEGRAKGYKSEARLKKLDREYDKLIRERAALTNEITASEGVYNNETMRLRAELGLAGSDEQVARYREIDERLYEVSSEQRRLRNAIPDAPFDKNYHEVVMKRMLRYAAENGFDKVAWTKGVQQAKRYNIGSTVDRIKVSPYEAQSSNEVDGFDVTIETINYSEPSIDLFCDKNGIIQSGESKFADLEGKHIGEVLGKSVAEDILSSNEPRVIDSFGIRIGGEGMKGFYDEMIPRFMNKYTKKWGAKVGEVTLPEVEEAGRTMWSVDVTPEMRESVMQGQPMFREGMGAISDREVSYENDPIAKWQGKPRYYGKRAAAFAERERARMQKGIEEAAKILGIEVEIITDASTLKGRKAKAKGWYDINSKKVVVVVPNHVSKGDAVRTVLHEGVAHHGLRELFGDGFDAMLDNIYNNVAPELKARIDAIAERTGVSTSVATEEYLASLAEDTNFEYAKRAGWWAKIKGYFMKMLRKLSMPGIALREEITDNELRYLLWRSYQNLVDPNSFLKPLGYLDDVAKQKELKVGNYAENTMATPRAADSGLWVPRSEYAKIAHQIATYPNKAERGHVFTDDFYYLCTNIDNDGNFTIVAQLVIEGNEDIINDIRRGVSRFIPIRRAKGLDSIIERIERRGGRTDWDNASIEGQSETNGRDDSIHMVRESESEANQRQIDSDGSEGVRYRLVDDQAEIERLESEPTIKAYRAMQVIDGELYPPMSAVVDGKLREPIALGQWERSEEQPELADNDGNFKLNKGNKKSPVPARYNPYFHSSATPLNDQFAEAQDRPNLVTVEVEIPLSEADGTSGYKAEKAKDAVGAHQWKAGAIQGQISGTRTLYLSRWDKPVRIVPDSEVAGVIAEMLEGTGIVMPSNVVTPSLRAELEKLGVPFVETDNQGKLVEGEHKGEGYGKVYGKKSTKKSKKKAEIIAEVEREATALGVPVRIVRSVDELPDADTRKRAVDGQLKGYFDPRTGEVALYEPNTDDANDAKRTVLHEIVGHKGLRQLIGEENYDKMMVRMLYLLPEAERMEVLRRAERHGWNAAIAMDEYLAEKAEEDATPTWWGRINSWLRAVLRNMGFNVMLTDADVTYLLWRSRKKLMGDTAFDMATNAILKQAARKSVNYDAESDNAIRHRGVEQGKKISEAVSDYYEKYTATTNADKFWGGVKYMATHLGDGGTRALLNDLSESQFEDIRSVRVLEEAIESAEGKPLRENEMVHKSLNAKTSRDARDMDRSQARYFQPMAKLLGKILGKKIDGRKIEIDDVERYLICKHSPENNEFLMKRAHAENRRKKIAERTKELMKGTMTEEEAIAQATSEYTLHQSDFRDDYSGLTELFPDDMVREAKITERTEELASNGVDDVTARQKASEEFENYKPTLEDREKMAADEVARFEAAVDGLHEELWGIINGINRDTIERLFRSGLISRSLYNDLKKRHKFYVPLSGWKNDAAADIYNYAMYGFDGTPIQTVIKKAFGTKYQARNILGSMFEMNMAAITEGNQNLVKQKLYNLALNHDTGVLQIVDLWEVKDGEGDAAEWKPAPKPELRPTMSDAEMQKALTDYQNKLMEMEKDGKARKAVNSLADNFGKHTTDKEAKRHHVELLVNGRKVVIWVNGNPKLAQAINGDLKVKKELLFFNDAVDNANRFLAQVQTSLNPEFMISNFERDILSASRYNLIKYGPKYEASFMKHLAQLMPIVSETNADMRSDVWGGAGIFNLFALDRNTNNPNRKPDAQVLDMNNPLHREFVNFLNYGGKTGYVERKQAEDLQQRINKLSKREQSIIRKYPAEVAGWAVDTIEHLNEGIENATRFAAYLTARERGKSVTEAVFEAKEVSVNFNMQGSGAWGNASYRKLYNYFNVGLQSLRREKNLGREFPKAYIANLAFMMALGAISTVLLTADWDGDDEDEYMGLSDFNRYNYINVKTENGFIHYSLPQDLRAFYAIGCISTEWAMGKIDGSRAVKAYTTQANNYTPLSFVSTTIDREPDSNPLKNLAMSFVPSAAVPGAEIAVNEDFLGRRIHNQNQWNEYEPEWQRAGYRTPEWVINASKALSEAGGGTEHKRGVWFTEINPSNAWHIMDSYGGGFLDFAQKTYNLVEREFAGKEHELRDYPMVSKFYVESGQDYSKQRVVNDRYRMYREDYETIDNELNGYLKDKSNALGKLSVRAKEERLPESVVNKERAEIEKTYEDNVKRVKESPNYWIYESFVPYEKGYNKLNSNLGKARKYGSEQTEKELSGEMYNVRKKLVDEIDAKRERPIDRVRQWLGN